MQTGRDKGDGNVFPPHLGPLPRGERNGWRLILYVLGVLIFQEVVFRAVFPLPEVRGFNRVNYMNIPIARMKDKGAIRNLRLIWESLPDNAVFVHDLNSYGFRDKEWKIQKPEGCQRVMFVGDSFAEGTMALQNETISAGFSRSAKDSSIAVEAMNLGVMGTGLDCSMRLALDAVLLFRPDYVFLLIYANDLPSHPVLADPETFKPYSVWKPRLFDLIAMKMRGDMLPMRWNIRSRKFHSTGSEPLNPWHKNERKLRHFVTERIADAILAGRFNPYRIGGSRYMKPLLEHEVDMLAPLRNFRYSLEKMGARLFVVYLPERGQVTNYYQRFEKEYSLNMPPPPDLTGPEYQKHQEYICGDCREAGIPFMDLTPLIRSEEEKGNHLYWDYDDHMRGAGYLLVGRELYKWWRMEL